MPDPGTRKKLNIIWRGKADNWDYFSTTSITEKNQHPTDGALFYIPADNFPGAVPLYRLYNGINDSMESTMQVEWYHVQQGPPLGYMWPTQNAARGLHGVARAVNVYGEHATVKAGEILAGYSHEDFGAFAYPRWHYFDELYLELTVGSLSVASNAAAGGAVFSYKWNGIEYVNINDNGRQLQSSVFIFENLDPAPGAPVVAIQRNPTEAGAAPSNRNPLQLSYYMRPEERQGSPVFLFHNDGNSQITRAIPLEFNPHFFGGGNETPVIYSDMLIGKNIELGWSGYENVAKYVTSVTVPWNLPASYGPTVEIPGVHLRANFNQLVFFDAARDLCVAPVNGWPPDQNDPARRIVAGGPIAYDPNSQVAIAFYGVLTTHGGSVTNWSVANFGAGGDSSPLSPECTRINAVYQGALTAGENVFTSWIITGYLEDVKQRMRELYILGVTK